MEGGEGALVVWLQLGPLKVAWRLKIYMSTKHNHADGSECGFTNRKCVTPVLASRSAEASVCIGSPCTPGTYGIAGKKREGIGGEGRDQVFARYVVEK